MARKVKDQRARGQITERGDRKWLVRVFIGMTAEGKRDYKSEIVHGTISQAQQKRTAMLGDIDTDQFVPNSNQTVKQFIDGWLKDTAPLRVTIGTLINYKSAMVRVVQKLGHIKLSKLAPQHVQRMYAEMWEIENLSIRTIEGTHTILKMALEQAVEWKLISKNPTKGATRPDRKEEDNEPEAFSSEEVDLFLEAAKSHPLSAMWLAFLATGLRPQEMFALKWTDIEQRTIRVPRNGLYVEASTTVIVVQRCMKHIGKGRYEISNVMKTKKSKRVVSIPTTLDAALNAHRKSQAQFILAAGPEYERNGLIFSNRLGRPLDVNNVRDQFHALVEIAKVRKIKLYGLRHTHATQLLIAGVHLKTVSERIGHASVMLTGDVYSHVLPETENETANTVESLINRPKKSVG